MKSNRDESPTFRVEDVDAALRRAARKALELGLRTGTPVYVSRDGQIVDLVSEAKASEDARAGGHG